MFSNKLRLLLSSIIAVTVCHVASLAQVPTGPASTVEIHGQVRFADGGAPAENILVRLESYDGGGSISEAFTDRLGKFRFPGLQPAQYSVKVHQTGYRDAQEAVDMQTSSSGLVLLQLSKDTSKVTTSTTGTINAAVPAAAQKEFDKGIAVLAGSGKDKMTVAARCFEKAITTYPQFVEARLKLGTVYMDLEQWDKAKNALEETLQIDPKASNALFALSEIYLRQNKLSDAEQVLMKGLEIDDRSFLGHLNLARVNWEQARQIKDLNQAKPVLEKCYQEVKQALLLNPNLPGAHLLKGNLLLRVARTSEAVSEFDEYLRLEPNGPMATETRALVDKIKKASLSRNFRG
jgi:regulator of sirC expression with transglutaminase-like and TPR domain